MAGERRTPRSPRGAGRRASRRQRVPGARVRGPAAARGGGSGGNLGGGRGGQCRQPVRGDGCSFSPRQPGRAGTRWRRAAEVAANCAPSRDARGMSPRGACALRRGPARSLPQPPRGEGFLLAARTRALPAPASMPSAPPRRRRAGWIRCSWFSGGPGGGGAGGGARDLSLEERIRERSECGSSPGKCVGLRRCWQEGNRGVRGAGNAQVGRWGPSFTALGSAHRAAALQEVCGRGGHSAPSRLCSRRLPQSKVLGSRSRSPALCLPEAETQRTFGRWSGGWSILHHPRRSCVCVFLKPCAFSGRLSPDCISRTKTMRTPGRNDCSNEGRGSL